MASNALRLAIIGCGGNMRGAHLPRIKPLRGVQIVAACDTAPKQTQLAEEAWGKSLAHYTDYRKMLRDEKPTAIVISTPHTQHFAQIKHALGLGIHVLVEKPMTTKAAHAKQLLELAKRKRKILHVAYQRHHDRYYLHVRNLIAAKKIGTLRSVVGYVTQNWSRVKGWRLDPQLAGGGMFMDTGSHLVAAALYLSGLHVKEITALNDNAGKYVDINTAVSIRFANGAIGSLSTIGNAANHDEALTFHGDKGTIVMHQHQWRLQRVLINGEPVHPPKSLKADNPDAAFVRWLKGGKGYARPKYALEVARISESTYKAVQRKATVRIIG